jgi:predicted amidohydrolase YtcJ
LAGAILLCFNLSWCWETPVAADTVLVHARIYTVNPQQPWADALAIGAGRIIALGIASDINRYRGASTQVIDAHERLVLPGFTDSHIHFLEGSQSLLQVNLDEATMIVEIQQKVKAYAAAHPELPWILGRGWSYAVFKPSALPDKSFLDEIIPDRPVYLESYDGHTWWANSKALKLAGITKQTLDPAGGRFVRDPVSGEPTGAVVDDAADAVVRHAIPVPTRAQIIDAIRQGMKEANRAGIVRAICPGGVHVQGGDFTALDAYDELRNRGELTVRFQIARRLEPPEVSTAEIQEIEESGRRYHDEWISAGAAKFFLDGVVEAHTAAMLEPYSDNANRTGSLLWRQDKYKAAVTALDERHIQIFTHAIGDRAVRLALDAYEAAAKANQSQDARHRIEHIENVSAQDVPRFGKLGVIASFQPLHAYPNEDLLQVWLPHVGPERAQRGFAWHSVANTGASLAFGSDWPIVTLNPWPGIQNALTRQTTEGNPPGGWEPQQRVTLPEAIRAYTLGAVLAGHRETTEGSIEPGKVADLIVLSQDLFKIEPRDIGKTEVLLTMVGGKVVYQSANWPVAPATTEAK